MAGFQTDQNKKENEGVSGAEESMSKDKEMVRDVSDLDDVHRNHLTSILSYYQRLTPNSLPNLSPGNSIAKAFGRKVPKKSITKSVVSVSTFVGVHRMIDCSGVIVDCGSGDSGKLTILTTAKAFRFPKNSSRKFYHVIVRLFDGQVFKADEEYVDFRLNVAVLNIDWQPLESVKLNGAESSEDEVDIFVLGRDFLTLTCMEGCGVLLKYPPSFGCDELLSTTAQMSSKTCEGGPVITESGDLLGINFVDEEGYAHLLPSNSISSMLLSVWHFRDILYPWYGLSVINTDDVSNDARAMLSLSSVHMSRLCVKKVYSGSPAHELGVCPGDRVMNRDDSLMKYVQELFTQSKLMFCFRGKFGSGIPFSIGSELKIQRCIDDEIVVVEPEFLSGNNRLFCICWPFDDEIWGRDALKGSQRTPILTSWNPSDWQ